MIAIRLESEDHFSSCDTKLGKKHKQLSVMSCLFPHGHIVDWEQCLVPTPFLWWWGTTKLWARHWEDIWKMGAIILLARHWKN